MEVSTIIGIVGGVLGILGSLSVASVVVFGGRARATIESQNSYIEILEKQLEKSTKEKEQCQRELHEERGITKALRGDVVKSIVAEVKKVKK